MATVQPSRNPMLDKAWKDHKRDQRAEKKATKEEPAPVVPKPPASKQVVRKKAGKVKNAKQPRDPGRKQEK